jgi:hypothetical protein
MLIKFQKHDGEFDFKVGQTSFMSKATEHLNSQEYWRIGHIITRYGIVGLFEQNDLFQLGIVHEGRYYQRTYMIPCPTERQVKLRATQFAREITGGKP